MASLPSSHGVLPFGEWNTWYNVTGDLGSGRALVVLHGGPGSTHDYLLALAGLAEPGRPVVHYDQLGNGGSTHLPDRGADFWTVRLFLDELDNLLRGLGIADDYVLFGHSWGGLLAAEHASARPAGLRGLIIANAPASYPLWLQEMKVLRDMLPPGVNETLLRHEEAGTTDDPAYEEATMAFYAHHVCRLDPWPEYLLEALERINLKVYQTMWGVNEFHFTGNLKKWDITPRLGEIRVPTLLLSGRYDEFTPAEQEVLRDGIPSSEWVLFEESAHLPHVEETKRFLEVLEGFLSRVEREATLGA